MAASTLTLPELPAEVLCCVFDALEEFDHLDAVSKAISLKWLKRSLSRNRAHLAATCQRLYAFYRFDYSLALDCSCISWDRLDRLTPADFSRIFKRFPNITSVDITLTDEMANGLLRALLRQRSRLHPSAMRCLILDDSVLSDAALVELVRACPTLQALHVSRCDTFTDRGLRTLTEGLSCLRELSLDSLEQSIPLFASGFESLGLLKQLERLSLEYRMDIPPPVLRRVLPQLQHLVYLSLSNTRITIEELESTLPRLHSLESLKIACCVPTSAERLIRALPPLLEALDARGTVQFSDLDVKLLVKNNPKLVELEAGCDPSAFRSLSAFGNSSKKLRTLRLCNAQSLRDVSTAKVLGGMNRLRSLALLGATFLGDDTIMACANLPELQNFHVQEVCVSPKAAKVLERAVNGDKALRNLKIVMADGSPSQEQRFQGFTDVTGDLTEQEMFL